MARICHFHGISAACEKAEIELFLKCRSTGKWRYRHNAGQNRFTFPYIIYKAKRKYNIAFALNSAEKQGLILTENNKKGLQLQQRGKLF